MPREPGTPTDHRARLIAAMSESIAEEGYRETTVADVVRIARTSRRSFYEHFQDRDACYLALLDGVNDGLMAAAAAAVDVEQPWERQVDQALGAYLDGVAAQPALSQSFVRELPVISIQQGRDVREVRSMTADVIKAILRGAGRGAGAPA